MYNSRRVQPYSCYSPLNPISHMKSRQSFSQYDYRPPEMLAYLRHYGYHFSRRMHDFAVSRMRRDNKPITPWTKEKVEQVIHKYGITLENAIAYDHVHTSSIWLLPISTVLLSPTSVPLLSLSRITSMMKTSPTVLSSIVSMPIVPSQARLSHGKIF